MRTATDFKTAAPIFV